MVSMGGPNMGTEVWGFSTRGQNLGTKVLGEDNVPRLRQEDRQGVYLRDMCQQMHGLQSLEPVLTKAWQDPALWRANYQQ